MYDRWIYGEVFLDFGFSDQDCIFNSWPEKPNTREAKNKLI